MRKALEDIITITNDTHAGKTRVYTALNQIQCLALDGIRKEKPSMHPFFWVLIGIYIGLALWAFLL